MGISQFGSTRADVRFKVDPFYAGVEEPILNYAEYEARAQSQSETLVL